MKLGTLVQYKAYDTVLDTGYVSKYDEDPEMIWVTYSKLGPQRVRLDSTMMEVISEAR
jgi:hypothetical protein